MPKKPLSVTLDEQNLLWLRGRAAATRRRSLSEALDAVVTAARTGGAGSVAARSVVATIDIAPDDPLLGQADAAVTAMVTASLGDGLGGGETESAPQDEGVVVAERAAVTDTHALIFHAAGGAHLGKKARAMFAAAESGQALIYVPAAVMWEVGLLARLVKINLR